ncbi:MAG: hypothetical protein WAL53_06165 [Nitrososphaeraceae archaeon]
MSKIMGLDMVGIDSNYATDSLHREDVILRMDRKHSIADYCPYLIVTDNMKKLDANTDLFMSDPLQSKDGIKRKAKRGLGIEISISSARKLEAHMLGRWMRQAKFIHEVCNSNKCQFILSSGAYSIHEMVSARTIESILKFIGISATNYWEELSEWLETKNKAKWIRQC